MSLLADDRIIPLASMRVYDPGEGDPLVTFHAFNWYHVLLEDGDTGTPSTDASGRPLVELLPEIGLTCRPFLFRQDTRIAHFSTSGGTWEERRPGTGAPRTYRLTQTNTATGVTWSATSSYFIPENPSVAFSVLFVDSPSDWDTVTLPPFLRIEFGAGWGLYFGGDGAFLQRFVSGSWVAVKELPTPANLNTEDSDDAQVWLRCQRGRIGVSVDYGRSYVWYGFPDSFITVPAAAITFRGQGGMTRLGVHQLRYFNGQYLSRTQSTGPGAVRTVGSLSFAESRYLAPTGTSVAYTDLSVLASQAAQYRVTLTPAAISAVPFTFYKSPEAYVTFATLPTVVVNGTGAYTTPFDGAFQQIEFNAPPELGDLTVTARVRRDPAVAFDASVSWDRRKAALYLGDWDGTTDDLTLVFVGYLRNPGIGTQVYHDDWMQLTFDSAAVHMKEREWSDFDRRPFGGMTLNTALDLILASEGLTASYRNWDADGVGRGAVFTFDLGLPEDPFEWVRRGESKWSTMQRLAALAGMELGVDEQGRFFTVSRDFVESSVTHTWKMETPATLDEHIRGVVNNLGGGERATVVLAQGKSQWGGTLWAYLWNSAAEQNKAAPGFYPWRRLVQEELSGTVTPGILAGQVQGMAGELFPLPWQPSIEGSSPILTLRRRQRVQVQETRTGIDDADEYAVWAYRIIYQPEMGRCSVSADLRLL